MICSVCENNLNSFGIVREPPMPGNMKKFLNSNNSALNFRIAKEAVLL
jgi:hypothetical protein